MICSRFTLTIGLCLLAVGVIRAGEEVDPRRRWSRPNC